MHQLDCLRSIVLTELSFIHQDNILYGITSLLDRLRAPGPPYHPAALDLACLARTLLGLKSLREEQLPSDDLLSHAMQWIVEAKGNLELLFGLLSAKIVDGIVVAQHVHPTLRSLNRFLAMTRYLLPPPENVLNKGEFLVAQKHGQNRYMVDTGCIYEDEAAILQEFWHSRGSGVFEHIGLRSGGAGFYDPMFFSREISSAKHFFTPGRVFMILWDADGMSEELREVVDEEPAVDAARRKFTMIENTYSGPYTGPRTVRRFVVVAQGVRSSYCLPVSTFNQTGCSRQQDQSNYGIVFTGHMRQVPGPLPGERSMVYPPLYIKPANPPSVPTSTLLGTLKTDIPPVPPYSALPGMELPPESRVDYRRLCEVEYNVCCRNIGLVYHESSKVLSDYAASVGLAGNSDGDIDAMDLS
ncbi:hypothetical protein BDV12DRAFT_204224 [Aspergillus spectabilis]